MLINNAHQLVDINKIIEGCKANDRKSQEKLYKRYFPIMMSMSMRYMGDQDKAAAIVNDGFLKVFTKIDSFKNKGSFEGWMRRIVFRSLSDAVRKDSNYLKFMVFEEHESKNAPHALSKLYEEDILKMIEQIPPASGNVFIAYAIQGYSHKEIAEMKGISVGTSKWHFSEARKKLQTLILNSDSNTHAG